VLLHFASATSRVRDMVLCRPENISLSHPRVPEEHDPPRISSSLEPIGFSPFSAIATDCLGGMFNGIGTVY
jgi:hypothetical protein